MDFALPSSKRPRVDEDVSQPEPSSVQTPVSAAAVDELDDIYGTPPSTNLSLTQPLHTSIPKNRDQDKISGAQASKEKFQLPGIGARVLEQSCGPVKPSNGDITSNKASLGNEGDPSKISSSDGNSLHQLSEGLETGHASENVPEIDSQASQNAEDDERLSEIELTKREAVVDSKAATVASSSHASRDNSAPCRKETGIELGQETRSAVEVHPSIDVASLSQQLPSVAVGNEAEPQYPSHSQSSQNKEVNANTEAHANTVQEGQEAILELEDGTLGQEEREEDGGVQLKTLEKVAEGNKADGIAEFQLDSSSYTETATETSSNESDDDYQLLPPEEQARRLMQEDGGSDDDGAGKNGAGSSSGPPRTQNEKPDEIVPKPDVIVTPEMKIEELGLVEAIVENIVLIEAKISGESQVLETGSVLCLADRTVIGVVAETLGRIQRPYYSVHFSNPAEIAEAGIAKGTQIFYSVQHSITVFTQALRTYKGSDASNLHDEEIGDDEMEFSDDEKEAEYKKSLKQAKQARRDNRSATSDGFSRAPARGRGRNRGRSAPRDGRPFPEPSSYNGIAQINYDDPDIDGPYNTLARPHNLHEIMGTSEAPIENQTSTLDAYRGSYGGSGPANRGRVRGRGNHPRSNQDRGGNLQGHDSHGLAYSYYSAPYEDHQSATPYNYSLHYNTIPPNLYPSQNGFTADHPIMQGQPSPAVFNYQNHQQQSSPQSYNSFPNQASLPNLPPGALVNPAFFSQASHSNQYSHPDSSSR